MRLSLLLVLPAYVLAASLPQAREEEAASYDGTRVLRLSLSSEADVLNLESLGLEVLSDHGVVVNTPLDVLVPEGQVEAFDALAFNYTVVHEDLGADIREEAKGFAAPLSSFAGGKLAAAVDLSWFNAYHTYADHISYISQVQAQFPTHSEIVTAGTSVEGRVITGLHIWGSTKGVKPAVVFHGTVHAREWIATPTVEYIAYSLLNNYANSTDVKTVVDTYDFYIFPVVNPDGFSFSQTTTRLWRKNRTPPPSGSTCYGVDLNRNWGIRWSDTGGASTSPCAEDYKGTAAESTPEIKGLIAFSKSLIAKTGITLYVDFHSYGQLFLYPWGYECTVNPEGSYYTAVGRAFETALTAIRGTDYTIEQACTLYKTTGASDDYHYGTLGVHDAYTIELPSTSSFVLSASNISPVARETWAGVLAMLKRGGFGG